MKSNKKDGTRIDEIANGIYRISTAVPPSVIPGGFTFNQYLVADDSPLLYHTGPRKMFPLVQEAIASVIPVENLRYIGFSHYESDECGSLNEFLERAPDLRKDAKSALQEWAAARSLAVPSYETIAMTGPDHAPEFKVELTIDGHEPVQGVSSTRRTAEQVAATEFLRRERIWQ